MLLLLKPNSLQAILATAIVIHNTTEYAANFSKLNQHVRINLALRKHRLATYLQIFRILIGWAKFSI